MFASEYKWPSVVTLKHTYHQLKELSKQIAWRKYEERVVLLSIQRTAHGSDRNQYKRFVSSLKPPLERKKKKKGISRETIVTLPEAPFAYRKD